MYIGEVAKETGLTQKAIRLYESLGIIPAPTRVGRYRTYTQSEVDNLQLIKEAKALGLTLKQLKGFVVQENGAEKKLDWDKVETLLATKKAEIHAEIMELHAKIKRIDSCVREIQECSIED